MFKFLIASGILLLMAGCSTNPIQERERRFQPAPTLPPAVAQLFVAECNAAIAAKDVPRIVDSCSALTAVNCGAWIDLNILAAEGILMRDSTLSAVDAATTIAAGAFGLSPGAVAAVGFGQLLGHLYGQVEKTGLGAPETYAAQSKMLEALDSCSTTLAQTVNLTFAQAVLGVDSCRRVCSNGAASAITTQAIQGVKVEASPTGKLMLRRVQ